MEYVVVKDGRNTAEDKSLRVCQELAQTPQSLNRVSKDFEQIIEDEFGRYGWKRTAFHRSPTHLLGRRWKIVSGPGNRLFCSQVVFNAYVFASLLMFPALIFDRPVRGAVGVGGL